MTTSQAHLTRHLLTTTRGSLIDLSIKGVSLNQKKASDSLWKVIKLIGLAT